MSKKNLPYIWYELLEFMPIFALFMLLGLVIVVMQCIHNCCGNAGEGEAGGDASGDGEASGNAECCRPYHGLIKIGKVSFGPPMGVFGKRERHGEQEDRDDRDDVFINDTRVPDWILALLGLFMISFGILAMLIFWDIFLIRESSSCDNNIDCFARFKNTSEENSTFKTVPISDCSEYEVTDNITISCFEFVYELGDAIGTIGGLITGVQLVMKMISIAVIYIYNSKCASNKCCKYCLLAVHALIVAVTFAGALTAIQVLVGFLNLTIGGWIKALLYVLTICLALVIPWGMFPPEGGTAGTNYKSVQVT